MRECAGECLCVSRCVLVCVGSRGGSTPQMVHCMWTDTACGWFVGGACVFKRIVTGIPDYIIRLSVCECLDVYIVSLSRRTRHRAEETSAFIRNRQFRILSHVMCINTFVWIYVYVKSTWRPVNVAFLIRFGNMCRTRKVRRILCELDYSRYAYSTENSLNLITNSTYSNAENFPCTRFRYYSLLPIRMRHEELCSLFGFIRFI